MAASPFRELFVELPAVLFDVLKFAGEESVRRAGAPANARLPSARVVSNAELLRRHQRALMPAFAWVEMQAIPSPTECSTIVVARLLCGHCVRYEIADQAVAATSLPDALCRAVDARPRSCFCVPRPPSD